MPSPHSYTKALVPDPYVIMGVRLLPFSLGHLILMRRFECKFGDDSVTGRDVQLSDLLLAIQICSRTFDEFLTDIENPEFQEWVEEWGTSLGNTFTIENGTVTTPSLEDKLELFIQYMREHTATPKYWENAETKGDSGGSGDWMRGVINVLVSECGYTKQEALNASFSQTMTDYLTYCERQGTLSFLTPDEEADIELMEQQKEQTVNG